MNGPALVLIGGPGSGKSTVGAQVAARIGARFVDTDAEVERRFGQTRAEIFADQGEAAFRAAEEEIALHSLGEPGVVLALGSGAVGAVRDALARQRVVWLRVSALHAARRLGLGALGVPLLVQLRTEMDQELRRRAPLWAEVAPYDVDTDRLEVAAVVEQVCHVLEGVQP